LDWRALGYAVLIELALLVVAAFGGPHGELGGLPWILQLPGIVFVLYPPGGAFFAVSRPASGPAPEGAQGGERRLTRRACG
jgi:hypothetical protein